MKKHLIRFVKGINSAEAFDVQQPELLPQRKKQKRLDDGTGEHENHSEPLNT